MALATPTIYTLEQDYDRFGLTYQEAMALLAKRFVNRFDPMSGVTGKGEFGVYHIQDGDTVGSLRWWLGVDASANWMSQKDGSLLRVIPEEHGPWTNGDVTAPTPEAAKLIAKPGNKNIWSRTVEAAGKPGVAMPDAQIESLAWLGLKWIREDGVPRENLLRHGWINSVTRSRCGLYLPQVLEIIDHELSSAKPEEPTYPPIVGLPFDLNTATGWQVLNGLPVAMIDSKVTALRNVVPRTYASDSAPASGPTIKAGDARTAKATFNQKDGTQWFLLDDGSRVRATAFTPVIEVKPRERKSA